jgi:hypothetical protein
MLSKSLINMYTYICRPGMFSTLSREDPLCGGQKSMKRYRTMQSLRRYWALSPEQTFLSASHHKGSEHLRRGESARAGDWGGVMGSVLFWIWHDYHSHELTAAVNTCTVPTQRAIQPHSQQRWFRLSSGSMPYWRAVGSGSCWERENHSLLKM